MDNMLSIKVTIANRQYPLRVAAADKEKVDQAAKLIGEKIKENEQNYAVSDPQDLLAMCVLQLANENYALQEEKSKEKSEAESSEKELVHFIDGYLMSL